MNTEMEKVSNRNVCIEINKMYFDTERQYMRTNMRSKGSLAFYNDLKSSWENKLYTSAYPTGYKR